MAKNLDKQLKNILREEKISYLNGIAIGSQKTMLDNFKQEKDVDGEDFMGLEDSTARIRKKEGYGGYHKILQRTKTLMNNIKVIPDFKSMSWIIDSVDYGEYLHDGIDSKKGKKQWNILNLPKKWDTGGKEESIAFNQINDNLKTRVSEVIQEIANRIDNL